MTNLFAFNSGTTISGTTQVGNIAVGGYPGLGGLQWWAGPDETDKYIICAPIPDGNQPTPYGNIAYIGFCGTLDKTDQSFIDTVNVMSGQNFNASSAKTWIDNQEYWTNFNYLGNGNQNTVSNAYNGKIYINGSLLSATTYYYRGNNNALSAWYQPEIFQYLTNETEKTMKGSYATEPVLNGTNDYQINSISNNKVVVMLWRWTSYSGAASLNGLKIKLNGTFYSMEEAVTNNLIRPSVFIMSHMTLSMTYVVDAPLNMYSGVTQCTGTYSTITIVFVLNNNVTMDYVRFWSSKNWSSQSNYADGFLIWEAPYEQNILSLSL